jgi:hypothetical protein
MTACFACMNHPCVCDEVWPSPGQAIDTAAPPITYHPDLIQGSEEWHAARLGILTASEMCLALTAKTLKTADNDKTRMHVYELAAQRISNYVEPSYVGDEMLRGHEGELDARILYNAQIAPVTECGFITNTRHGFTLGYSPDGLIGGDGLIEVKSRRQKFQIQTIVEHVWRDQCLSVPIDYMLQLQTGLLVSERRWVDFLSYSGGLPLVVIRVWPDEKVQQAIIAAAGEFERKIKGAIEAYQSAFHPDCKLMPLIPTERKIEGDILI